MDSANALLRSTAVEGGRERAGAGGSGWRRAGGRGGFLVYRRRIIITGTRFWCLWLNSFDIAQRP